MMNLGAAGLIDHSAEAINTGTAQTRIDQSRTTISTVNAGGPVSGFKDEETALVGQLSGLHEFPAHLGAAFLRFSAELNGFDGDPNIVEQDGNVGRLDVQYLRGANPQHALWYWRVH